jgi:cell division protein FtsB
MIPAAAAMSAAAAKAAGIGARSGEVRVPMARPRLRRRPRRKVLRWVALGVVLLLGLLYYRPIQAYVHTNHAVAARAADVSALTARKRQLEERLAEIRSGATLVRGARRLGLVKPGEHLFIVRGIPAWRRAHARR